MREVKVMDTSVKRHEGFLIFFTVIIAASAIVFIEPAPYDFLLITAIICSLFTQTIIYKAIHFLPVILLLLFIEANLLSFFFVKDIHQASIYFVKTIYMVVSWFGIAGMLTYYRPKVLTYIFTGYVVAAMITVIPGIVAYNWAVPKLDFLLWQDRLMGFFKDPNVFGPFLVPPGLYALWKMGKAKISLSSTLIWMLVFLTISLGIMFSYSRAAWGNFILAIGIFFILLNEPTTKRMKILFISCMIFLPVLIYTVVATDIGALFFDRLGLQSYDQTRFQEQEASLDYLFQYPFGFGPGQSELFLDQSTHNLFIRTIGENGLLGMISFHAFLLVTIVRSIWLSKHTTGRNKGFFIIITSSIIGILFNSMFIDTMHWRHLWLLLALPWIGVSKMD